MSIENIYSYLEYLTLTVDQLGDAVMEREEESAVYEARIEELEGSLAAALNEIAQLRESAPVENQDSSRLTESLQKISELEQTLANARKELAAADARVQLAEDKAQKFELKAQEYALAAKAAKQNSKHHLEGQIDLFGSTWGAPSAPAANPVPAQPNRIANDENALILAKRLDSTIDKVQRLIREARG